MNPHTVKQTQRNVLVVKFTDITAGWRQWLMITGDRHHDNVHCDRNLEKRHLDKAKERGALILDVGDLFCAMQGKYDPRSSMDDIRPEDVGEDYLDRIVKHAAEFYAPYAKNFLALGHGNHETNIRKRHGTDLTSNLIHRLNAEREEGQVYHGYYAGWIRFLFRSGKAHSANLKYHHGYGGGAPVTRGVIQTNRMAVYLPDADIVAWGHIHNAWHVPINRERLSNRGKTSRDVAHFLCTPGYKNEFDDGGSGFHIEHGRPPKPIGCVWVRFEYSAASRGIETKVEVDVT